jgi:DNA-binding XRE family transcriptional regulator
MTPTQCRAARAILNLKRADLAEAAGIAEKTLGDFERKTRTMLRPHVDLVRRELEKRGIEFLGDNGIRWPRT